MLTRSLFYQYSPYRRFINTCHIVVSSMLAISLFCPQIERNLNQSDEYYAQLQAFRALNTDIFTRPEEEYLSKLPRQAYSPLPARTPQPTQDPLYRHTGLFRVNSRLYPEPVDENESGPYTDKEGVRVSIPHSYLPPRDASTKKVYDIKTRLTYEPDNRYLSP